MGLAEYSKPIEILLVEESVTDERMVKAAFEYAKVASHLHVVDNGVDAMAFLRHEGPHANAPGVHLILLDLHLPKKNGQEVLAEIKADAQLRTIPVVVLTSSQAEADILQTYGLYANCSITKPIDLAGFAEVIRAIEHFWFAVASLPQR
jgi:CheY-like chemotaxis protein